MIFSYIKSNEKQGFYKASKVARGTDPEAKVWNVCNGDRPLWVQTDLSPFAGSVPFRILI